MKKMLILRKFGTLVQAVWVTGIATALLTGCRNEGIEFAVRGQTSAEEVGLKIAVIGDFDRDDGAHAHVDNLGLRYQQTGSLLYSAFSIRNEGAVPIEFYLPRPLAETAQVALSALMVALIPWKYPADRLDGPPPAANHEYFQTARTWFHEVHTEWVFASGAHEEVRAPKLGQVSRQDFLRLRPGETATLRVHLKMDDESRLVAPQSSTQRAPEFLVHLAPDAPPTSVFASGLYTSHLEGWFVRLPLVPRMVVRRTDRDEYTHLYFENSILQALQAPHALPFHARTIVSISNGIRHSIPPEQAEQHFERLPIFVE
jgi:hypothetical protein